MRSTKIIVLGGLGRLGRAIIEAKTNEPDLDLKGIVVREGSVEGKNVGGARMVHLLTEIAQKGDVVIDATRAESVKENLVTAAEIGTPYVLAVTGLSKETEETLRKVSKKIAVVAAPNLSVGIAVLEDLASRAAGSLRQADVQIEETHHKNKKDAPSGTALALAKAVKRGSGEKEVEIQSIREGEVVGDHRIRFLMKGERLELTHIAESRLIFAIGALTAARFVARAKPGVYSMRNVLGLE